MGLQYEWCPIEKTVDGDAAYLAGRRICNAWSPQFRGFSSPES